MQLIGLARLGKDAESRRTNEGKFVLQMALAFNYGKKGQDGKRPTQWVDAAWFGDRAERAAQYLVKGSLVNVYLAEPHIETYQRNGGGEGFKLVAYVNDLEFAGSPQQAHKPPEKQAQQQQRKSSDFDDDIPF